MRLMIDEIQEIRGKKEEGREMENERKKSKRINSVRDLEVYKLAFDSAMVIFEI